MRGARLSGFFALEAGVLGDTGYPDGLAYSPQTRSFFLREFSGGNSGFHKNELAKIE